MKREIDNINLAAISFFTICISFTLYNGKGFDTCLVFFSLCTSLVVLLVCVFFFRLFSIEDYTLSLVMRLDIRVKVFTNRKRSTTSIGFFVYSPLLLYLCRYFFYFLFFIYSSFFSSLHYTNCLVVFFFFSLSLPPSLVLSSSVTKIAIASLAFFKSCLLYLPSLESNKNNNRK